MYVICVTGDGVPLNQAKAEDFFNFNFHPKCEKAFSINSERTLKTDLHPSRHVGHAPVVCENINETHCLVSSCSRFMAPIRRTWTEKNLVRVDRMIEMLCNVCLFKPLSSSSYIYGLKTTTILTPALKPSFLKSITIKSLPHQCLYLLRYNKRWLNFSVFSLLCVKCREFYAVQNVIASTSASRMTPFYHPPLKRRTAYAGLKWKSFSRPWCSLERVGLRFLCVVWRIWGKKLCHWMTQIHQHGPLRSHIRRFSFGTCQQEHLRFKIKSVCVPTKPA